MQWKKKTIRVVRRFALFPIRINNNYRWLETVYIIQRRNWLDCWENDEFVDRETYKLWRKGNKNG